MSSDAQATERRTSTLNRGGKTAHRLAGLLLAGLVGGGLYWLLADLGLAVGAGLIWGGALAAGLRIYREYPAHATGDGWRDGRWTGLYSGLVTLGALIGVSPTLPVDADLRFGLAVLVLGAGTLGYVSGTLAELERADG